MILTNEEIIAAWESHIVPVFGKDGINVIVFARAVEAAIMAKMQAEPLYWITPDGEGWRLRLEPPVKDVPLGWKALYEHPPVPEQVKPLPDAFPQAHRLALELECLILSCNDTAAYSKWWDSANEALDQWREFCTQDTMIAARPKGE